jgi:hypothetical protein
MLKGKKKKNKAITIMVPKKYPKPKNIPKNYQMALRNVHKHIKDHFKKDGWDLSYSFFIEEIFYEANGFHLDAYLLPLIFDGSGKLELKVKDSNLVISKYKK